MENDIVQNRKNSESFSHKSSVSRNRRKLTSMSFERQEKSSGKQDSVTLESSSRSKVFSINSFKGQKKPIEISESEITQNLRKSFTLKINPLLAGLKSKTVAPP